MKKTFILTTTALLTCGLNACSPPYTTTTIYPQGGETYQAVSLSADQGNGQKDSMNKATKLCRKQGKQVIVVNTTSVYQGQVADKQKVSGTGMTAVAEAAASIFAHTHQPTVQDNDYRTVLNFVCK